MDVTLYHQERGEGVPLVLLHGNGEDHTYFQHQIDYFSSKYWVIAVDTRGHGRSPRGTAPFTLEQFALDLKDLLDGMGVERCHLLGFSDGANIALIFSLRWPWYVEKLILNGGNLDPFGVKPELQAPIIRAWVRACVKSVTQPRYRAKAERLALMTTQPKIPLKRLRTLNLPTLVVAGTDDMIREEHTRAMARAIPGARLELLPGDHFVANRSSGPFNLVVDRFLTEG